MAKSLSRSIERKRCIRIFQRHHQYRHSTDKKPDRLLDTHIFLWFISDDKRLSSGLRDIIRDLDNEVYLSVVSLWEAMIKFQLGKLPLPEPPETYLPRQRERHSIASLSVDEASVAELAKLPPLHRDPFDRLLVCQAIRHDLTIATVDQAIQTYPVPVIDLI